jgi:hypothetical protein
MALPALNPNATLRLYFDYTSMGKAHTLIVRTNGVGDDSELQGYALQIADALTSVMRAGDTINGVRRSAAGSNITFPFITTPMPGQLSGSATIWDQDPESAQWSVVGRGISTGRKVRYEIFTPIRLGTWPENNRWEAGENATVDTFRTDFTAAIIAGPPAPTQGVSIGGDVVLLNPYVNLCHNAYWQRRQRRG